jgi:hypothetical protein
VSVLLNEGNGVFAAQVTYPGGASADTVSVLLNTCP